MIDIYFECVGPAHLGVGEGCGGGRRGRKVKPSTPLCTLVHPQGRPPGWFFGTKIRGADDAFPEGSEDQHASW